MSKSTKLFESIKDKLLEVTSTEEYWDAKEIDRKGFMSLLKFNFGVDFKGNNYIITSDGYERSRFYAQDDNEARSTFKLFTSNGAGRDDMSLTGYIPNASEVVPEKIVEEVEEYNKMDESQEDIRVKLNSIIEEINNKFNEDGALVDLYLDGIDIIDKYELFGDYDSDYGLGETLMRQAENILKKSLNDSELYLEPYCPGRVTIVSDKVQEIMNESAPQDKKYIMSEEEYNALDKAFTESLLYDDWQVIYQDEELGDCYGCASKEYLEGYKYKKVKDNDTTLYIVPILEYMPELDSGFMDFVDSYGFDETDIKAYDELCKKAGMEVPSCEER